MLLGVNTKFFIQSIKKFSDNLIKSKSAFYLDFKL
jgi:hypothetical protein